MKCTLVAMLQNFLISKSQIFVISLSVCPWEALQAYSNKQSSLVRKFVHYEQKEFYDMSPGVNVAKH